MTLLETFFKIERYISLLSVKLFDMPWISFYYIHFHDFTSQIKGLLAKNHSSVTDTMPWTHESVTFTHCISEKLPLPLIICGALQNFILYLAQNKVFSKKSIIVPNISDKWNFWLLLVVCNNFLSVRLSD